MLRTLIAAAVITACILGAVIACTDLYVRWS
jgi:hypothetical protein